VALERRDGDDAAEGWVVRIAPTDEWLAVSRRQLVAVRDMLVAEGL
jgi:two-component system, LytTR family, response regulator AlgR